MQVSVIIPTYNRRQMLPRALDGVLAQQGVGSVEIIVVDDGSTDGTAEFVREKYPMVRLIEQPHSGAPVARNCGIGLATGKFIALLDSDDELTTDSLACRIRALEANPETDLVCGDHQNYADNASVGSSHFRRIDLVHTLPCRTSREGLLIPDDFFDAQLRRPIVITSAMLLRRETLQPEDRFDESLAIGQDWEFALRFARRHRVGLLNRIVAKRHLHAGNLTRQRFSGKPPMLAVDRKTLSYEGLTREQCRFARTRWLDDMYEAAYALRWKEGNSLRALTYALPSFVRQPTLPKLKLLVACVLFFVREKPSA